MNSSQLTQKGFSEWIPFTEENVEKAPRKPGVYILRKAHGLVFGRLRGKSDILYIGSTEAQSGLKHRLKQYFHPGPTQWTNKRINKLLEKYEMEIAWCPCDEPSNLEHQLLTQYLEEHDELPPLNHATKRLLKKIFTETLHFTASISLKKNT
jgi:excinuclease UvrABC nuclease subunit